MPDFVIIFTFFVLHPDAFFHFHTEASREHHERQKKGRKQLNLRAAGSNSTDNLLSRGQSVRDIRFKRCVFHFSSRHKDRHSKKTSCFELTSASTVHLPWTVCPWQSWYFCRFVDMSRRRTRKHVHVCRNASAFAHRQTCRCNASACLPHSHLLSLGNRSVAILIDISGFFRWSCSADYEFFSPSILSELRGPH